MHVLKSLRRQALQAIQGPNTLPWLVQACSNGFVVSFNSERNIQDLNLSVASAKRLTSISNLKVLKTSTCLQLTFAICCRRCGACTQHDMRDRRSVSQRVPARAFFSCTPLMARTRKCCVDPSPLGLDHPAQNQVTHLR